MPEDRRLTIASTSRLSPDDVARHTFATARRGFDPGEVRSYLEAIARELGAAAARERELLDAVAAAEHKAAHPVLDEGTLTAALGQETAKVLKSAHDAAAELLARAEADAARLRAEAQEHGEQLQARAEQHASDRGAQADAAATEIRRRAQEEVAGRLESVKGEAEALVVQARAECRAMVHEAQELRARVLSDLTKRRRVLHNQIEQLRAGRERLAETIGEVRSTVDRVTDDLFRAEDEARQAAEAAGRQATQDFEDMISAEEAGHLQDDVGPSGPSGETGVGSPDGDEDEASRRQAVDDLFARLRAERRPETSTAYEGVTLLGPVEAPSPPPPPPKAQRPQAATGGGAVALRLPETETDTETEARAGVGAGAGAGAGVGVEDPEGAERAGHDGLASHPALARRDELLQPAVAGLSKRLKRTMQDDQNDILDRLRAKGGWAPDVLPPESDHQQRYVRAAVQQLDEAARAGALFVGAKADEAPPVGDVAVELAMAIVAPLRRRLGGEGAHADEGDENALIEHVGSAFREWKGPRIERVAADHAHSAFSLSVVEVTAPGGNLTWIVDDDGVECPDCDDNALAGAVPRGEVFPTGHAYPPAHPGCRCVLAPDTA
ncbi:MAG TPA: DivIVA domain-containing protein [Acidimicrobiales bacterium]|nr:DivIVA domain-containing protein [Acidimicrobiales bacterium]